MPVKKIRHLHATCTNDNALVENLHEISMKSSHTKKRPRGMLLTHGGNGC